MRRMLSTSRIAWSRMPSRGTTAIIAVRKTAGLKLVGADLRRPLERPCRTASRARCRESARSRRRRRTRPGAGRLPSTPITVYCIAPMRTCLPIGSMLGKSACHGLLPRMTTGVRCSTSAEVKTRPASILAKLTARPVRGRAEDADLPRPFVLVIDARAAVAPLRAQPHVDQRHRRAVALDRPRVLDRQVRTARHLEKALARREAQRAELLDDDRVRPELADRVAQRLVEAADERRHADDRRDADDDAEHGQRRAHLAGAQRVRSTSRRFR